MSGEEIDKAASRVIEKKLERLVDPAPFGCDFRQSPYRYPQKHREGGITSEDKKG